MCVALENELKAKNVDDRLCSEATVILRDETGKVCGVKVNPTAYYITDTSCISAATFRMNGCIIVSHAGVRIVNEEDAYTPNSEAIMNNGGETYMMVFDRTLVDKVTAAQTYIKAGYTVQADTLEGWPIGSMLIRMRSFPPAQPSPPMPRKAATWILARRTSPLT